MTKLLDHIFDGLGADLKAYNVPVKKTKGWQRRGRTGLWEPQGLLNHHTASNRRAGNMPALGIVRDGRSDLPGPLANFLGARDGTIVFVAKGRCNHAGEGGPERGIPEDSGNAYLLGLEAENDGIGEKWGDKLYLSMVVLNALIMLRLKKKGPYMAFDHREWTSRKIDRAGINSDEFRDDVRKQMKIMRTDGLPSLERR